MNATQTAPYLYTVSAAPSAARRVAQSSTFPLFGVLAALMLVTMNAPVTNVVPADQIAPLNDTQTDLTLAEVVGHFERSLGIARRHEAYRLGKLVMELSHRHQISPSLILAVIATESSYRPTVVSKAGAVGLMQLEPETAAEVARLYRIKSFKTEEDLYDPAVNLRIGVAYLAKLRRQFGHSLHYMAAYNLGPTALRKRLRDGNYELGSLDAYVRIVHERARALRGNRAGGKMPALIKAEALFAASL